MGRPRKDPENPTEPVKEPESLLEVVKMLSNIQSSLDTLNKKFDDLDTKYEKMDSKVQEFEKKMNGMAAFLNSLEQRGRNNSLRIFGLKVDNVTSKCAMKTSKYIFNKVLLPILKIAVDKKDLDQVPDIHSLIEYCHVLPSPKNRPDSTPIIVRLHSRLIRLLIFRHKKDFFSKNQDLNDCFITEDLTGTTYRLLKDLKSSEKILKAWTLNGRIKYTTKDAPDTVLYYKTI